MKKTIIIFLMLQIMFMPIYAGELSDLAEKMPYSASDILEETGENGKIEEIARKLFEKAIGSFSEYMKAATKASFIILAICALAGMGQSFIASAGIKTPVDTIRIAAVVAIALISIGGAGSVITEIGKSMAELKIVLNSLMPAFAMATASSGSPVSAVAASSATMVFANALIGIGEKIVFPTAYLFILIYAAAQITDNPLILKTARLIKWGVMACYKIALTLFTIYITMTGILSSGADAMAARAARVTIVGVVPVLGNILAGSADTLLAGATMLKNSIGIFGMAAAVLVCLLPFLRALCLMLAYKITAAIGATLAGGQISQMLDGVADSYAILLGLLASCCATVFIVMIICTAVVKGI